MRKTLNITAFTAALLTANSGQAQTAPSSAAPAPGAAPAKPAISGTEQWIQDLKKPTSWLSWGADFRIRNEYLNNSLSLSEDPLPPGSASPVVQHQEQDFIRLRARAWVTLAPIDKIDINARVVAEPRDWVKPAFSRYYPGRTGWEWQEGLIDNLNVKIKQPFDLPATVTVGRQDIMLGDAYNWWLVADGTPIDGSRTLFLDAARLTYELKDINTTIDAIGIYQQAANDATLPRLYGNERPLTEQNERGGILYMSNKSIKKTQVDAYFIYKNDVREAAFNGDNADIYTTGGKVTGDITDHWKYSVEGAYQFGSRNDPALFGAGADRKSINAFGINDRILYQFKDPLNNQVRLSHEYLSGDNPNTTGAYEGFDLLWGRWPRVSELYIYSQVREWRVAQMNNFHRVGPGWTFNPVKNLTYSLEYNAMFAPQTRNPAAPNNEAFGDGYFRGHFLQSVLRYKFSQHMVGHLWSEFIWSGDYYADRDMFSFIRAEVMFTF